MSLVTSTAFQNSSAIQTRASIASGTLATSDVDDNLLYQMLVALKLALSQANETDTSSVVSMLRCICKIVPSLPHTLWYICPLFWLAVALLQSSHMSFYVKATQLLGVTLENMELRGMFKQGSVSSTLLDGHSAFEDVACQLDQMLGLAFDVSFSFSLASVIFSHAEDTAMRHCDRSKRKTRASMDLGIHCVLIHWVTSLPWYRSQHLKDCHIDEAWLPEAGPELGETDGVLRIALGFLGVNDTTASFLVTSFIGVILSSAQGDVAETEILYSLLSDIAVVFPETVSMMYVILMLYS